MSDTEEDTHLFSLSRRVLRKRRHIKNRLAEGLTAKYELHNIQHRKTLTVSSFADHAVLHVVLAARFHPLSAGKVHGRTGVIIKRVAAVLEVPVGHRSIVKPTEIIRCRRMEKRAESTHQIYSKLLQYSEEYSCIMLMVQRVQRVQRGKIMKTALK